MLFALAPLAPNHYLPWVYFHSEALAFAALLAWFASTFFDSPAPRRLPLLVLAPLVLLAIVWLQWAGGVLSFAGDAWLATLYLGGLSLAMATGYRWAATAPGGAPILEGVAWPLVAAGCVSTVLCMAQWLRLEPWFGVYIMNLADFGRPFANLAQPNLLATLLVMGLAALAWSARGGALSRPVFVLLAAFISIGLCLTQSRAALVGAAGLVVWGLFKGRRRLHGLVSRGWLLGWLLTVVAASAAVPALHARLGFGQEEARSFTGGSGRWTMWAQVGEGIRQRPLTGYGWNATSAAQDAGATRFPGEMSTGFAHDVYLDAVTWFGVPVGLALAVLVTGWWLRRMRACDSDLAFFAISLSIPVLVHSLVEFPFAFMFFLFPVGVMAGAVEREHEGVRTFPARAIGAGLIGVALALIGVRTAQEYIPAEDDFRYVRFESMRVGHTPADAERPQFTLMTQLEALSNVGHSVPDPRTVTPEAVEQARKVARRYPWAPLTLRYAMFLEAAGHHADADREMQLLRHVYGESYHAGSKQEFDKLRQEWSDRRASMP